MNTTRRSGKKYCKSFESFLNDENLLNLNGGQYSTISSNISKINIYCQKNGIKFPAFKILKKEGDEHRPTYQIKCELDDSISTIGSGLTIKKAKEDACYELVKLILEATRPSRSKQSPKPTTSASQTRVVDTDSMTGSDFSYKILQDTLWSECTSNKPLCCFPKIYTLVVSKKVNGSVESKNFNAHIWLQ